MTGPRQMGKLLARTSMAVALSLLAAVPALAEQPSLPDLVRSVDSAVVEIRTERRVAAPTPGTSATAASLGSGFLVSADGRIMTAAHVVQVADDLEVRFVTGDVVSARIVNSSPSADVALIRAESVPEGVAPAAVGNSNAIEVGDQVFVIGAPYGISHSLTVGHVSARRVSDRLFGGFRSVELLQTDAVINQGNSGGPLFNMHGEVVGIVSHILSASGGYQGLGFAVTSNLAMQALLDEPGMWTGLDGILITDDVARALNLPQRAGILIQAVASGSPAAALGLRAGTLSATIGGQPLAIGGDIILTVHGIHIGEPDFYTKIRERTAELGEDEPLRLEVLRGGEVVELERTMGSLRSP